MSLNQPGEWSIMPATGAVFPSQIASEHMYLWDNYGYIQDGTTHIYAQAADKRMCARPEDRYWRAYWRHFLSEDGGKTWVDGGPAIIPRFGMNVYDAYNVWSGSVVVRRDGTKIAAYTGLAPGKFALQSIGIAVSEDGSNFTRISEDRPLLSAALDYDRLVANGYYLGPRESIGDIEREADGTFLCLRDPFLFPGRDGALHVFFGAKAAMGREIVRAVGHLVFKDAEQLREVEVLAPILVPDGDAFNQLELPNVFYRDGSYYLVISTTNLAYVGQPDLEAEKSVRLYRSRHLDRGWEPYGENGKHVILGPETKLYGLNVLFDADNISQTLICRAFGVGETFMPPSIHLKVGGDNPELIFPDDFWADNPCSV